MEAIVFKSTIAAFGILSRKIFSRNFAADNILVPVRTDSTMVGGATMSEAMYACDLAGLFQLPVIYAI